MKISRRQFGLSALISMSLPPLEAIAAQINVPSPAVSDIGEGIHLHYEERGNGTPIVFVHGSLSDYAYWQEQMEPFAAKYRVIASHPRHLNVGKYQIRFRYSDHTQRFVAVLHSPAIDKSGCEASKR